MTTWCPMPAWKRRRGCCCIVLSLLLLGLLRRRSIAVNHADGAQASEAQVLRALGWSMVSGLATGVGGAVVFCLESPQSRGTHGDTAPAVSNRAMGALLGAAVGVMMVLSADMIIPRVLRYGLSTALPIAAGTSTIYLLDALISWFELPADFGAGGGHGHSHGAPLLPLAKLDV